MLYSLYALYVPHIITSACIHFHTYIQHIKCIHTTIQITYALCACHLYISYAALKVKCWLLISVGLCADKIATTVPSHHLSPREWHYDCYPNAQEDWTTHPGSLSSGKLSGSSTQGQCHLHIHIRCKQPASPRTQLVFTCHSHHKRAYSQHTPIRTKPWCLLC